MGSPCGNALKLLVCGSGRKAQSLGNAHQVGHGFNLHLFHHLAPMDFHSNFTRAKFGSGLFVQQATDDQAHNLPFARGQRLVSGSQFRRNSERRLSASLSRSNRMLNRVEQILVVKRFRDEVNRAGLHRAHAHRNIAMAGDENDWNPTVYRCHFPLKLHPAQARQTDIQHEAGRHFWLFLPKEFPS